MRCVISIPIVAVQAHKTTRLLHDGGILTIGKDAWLVMGDHYGPRAVYDLRELGQDITIEAEKEDGREAILRQALEKGQI